MNFAGIPIMFSEACTATERVRVHVKARTQREAYHQRIDKKWRKRFGTKQVPAFYMINGSALGFNVGAYGGDRIMAHPALKDRLMEALRNDR